MIDSPAAKADPERLAQSVAAIAKPKAADMGRECADMLRARRERGGGRLGYPQRTQLEALEAVGK